MSDEAKDWKPLSGWLEQMHLDGRKAGRNSTIMLDDEQASCVIEQVKALEERGKCSSCRYLDGNDNTCRRFEATQEALGDFSLTPLVWAKRQWPDDPLYVKDPDAFGCIFHEEACQHGNKVLSQLAGETVVFKCPDCQETIYEDAP